MLEAEVAIKCKLQTQLNCLQEVSFPGYTIMYDVTIGTYQSPVTIDCTHLNAGGTKGREKVMGA